MFQGDILAHTFSPQQLDTFYHKEWCALHAFLHQSFLPTAYFLEATALQKEHNFIIKKATDNKCWSSMEKRQPSHTDGGNVSWYNHGGERDGGALKN